MLTTILTSMPVDGHTANQDANMQSTENFKKIMKITIFRD